MNQYKVRAQASARLQAFGELAELALRQALQEALPLETLRRVQALLEKLESPTAERLRAVRAVAILESIGSQGARGLLARLATGIPSAGLTRAAQSALTRLAKRWDGG